MKRSVLLLTALAALLAWSVPAAGSAPAVLAHQVEAVFDVPAHQVNITDWLRVPAGLDHLRLGTGLEVTAVTGPSGLVDPGSVLAEGQDEDGTFQRFDLAALQLAGAGGELVLQYRGTFHESVENTVFSRENVGNEITATISEEGIYLSGMAQWLVWHPEAMATHTVSCDTPAGYETVTQGRRTRHETVGDRLLTTWEAAHPSDGLNLIAHRFVVHEEPVRDGVVSYTFFLEDDPRLRATYMERTRAYIAMYEEMIGPYPYAKFATVENWFPTGYGMPSYTLLGGQVLRLPFIPYTSFGHEIAHNWWGNSIFVDTAEGNWCEGLTVYCADYHYKDLESPTGAYEYRRNVLKDYAAYVHDPSKDFPLSEFKSRHSGATRAVGYGKSMMVYHMIERMIGRETFLAGLQQVAREHRFRQTTWSDFFAAFAALSGRDLSRFQEQWLTRTGAVHLRVESVEFGPDKVRFKLHQGAPAYDLQVPVVVTAAGGDQEHVLSFDQVSQSFEIKADDPRQLAVDPGCNLFRRLHPEEIEPTLSQVLGVDVPAFVLDGPDQPMQEAARGFARAFAEMNEGFYFNTSGRLVDDAPPEEVVTNVVINPGPALLKRFLPAELVISGKTFFLGGKRYSLDENDLVFAAANPDHPGRTDLVILCSSPHRLEAMARRVVHYGKYSWLIMPAGQGPVVKGNWSLAGSPLVVARDR
jgi:aminopeptidase N